ncbi:MAG: WD40-like beta Propeller containing protein [Gemmatimonadetes bacterium]|jgi:dipeptidyl aminopeptidase/acylaminoacyl peptidase|nr:WD40-like beta Propeller containing protein [Gemmatimonadota bacterium]
MDTRIFVRAAAVLTLTAFALGAHTTPLSAQDGPASSNSASTRAEPRPMNWLDVQNMRQLGQPAPSPDGKWVLYTLSVPDWKEMRRQSDIYLVSTQQGAPSTKRLTYTADKSETTPTWSRDGQFFVFLSDRDAAAANAAAASRAATLPTSGPGAPYFPPAVGGGVGGASFQLYLMRPDGGEARKITDAKDGGITTYGFTKDGRWLIYRSGQPSMEQLFALPTSAIAAGDSVKPIQLTRHSTGVGLWRVSPDSKRIYFATADTVDPDARVRLEKRFDVRVRNAEVPVSSLWALDLESKRTTRLTRDTSYSVGDFTISPDGKWIGFHAISANRYERNILEQNGNADLYLLDVASGQTERLTKNKEIGESPLSFSPDSRTIAFSAPDEFIMRHNLRVYTRDVNNKGGQFKKLGTGFDGGVTIGFWSKDGNTIYFNEGVKATDQLMALDVASNKVRQITTERASLRASQDEETDRVFINRSDPKNPPAVYTVNAISDVETPSSWIKLTDANPWTRDLALGETEEIAWKGRDGTPVGGVLVKPVGYQAGKKYPLIVSIHGGPQSADVLSFNGGYGAQIYAGAGYVVLMPNYRNSTNYGQKFEIESQGDYFTKGYEDIMAGVDHLIAQGLVDSTQMGVLGWSAGGHWSNWILTHTNRFKAISTGAGVYNWISMYGESDTQRGRQWYLGDKMYWESPEVMQSWWRQSPAAYIKNAKTPTMIHVVDNDPRVPRPESEGLHMALKKLGVPTELYVYPGNTHGIPDPRNQLLKSTAEQAWMDYYVRKSGHKFAWRDVLKTVEDPKPQPTALTP